MTTRRSHNRSSSERGAVLLTVLLLIAVISSLAVAMVDDIRFCIRQAANTRLHDQALWYAMGAEELAKYVIRESWRADPGRSTLNELWARGPTLFPIEGGVIEGQVSDGSNCFNLNSLVEPDGNNRFVRSPVGEIQFRNLLRALQFGEGDAETLLNSAADWIDSDTSPSARGAEDGYYAAQTPPHRTANALVGQITELRAIRGFTEPLFQRVRPFVCARPNTNLSRINVNTMRIGDAELLVMLVGPALDLAAARRVIGDRPNAGYRSLTEFWAHRSFAGLAVPAEVRDQVSIRTQFFALDARVILQTATVSVHSVFEQKASGEIARLSRHFGDVM